MEAFIFTDEIFNNDLKSQGHNNWNLSQNYHKGRKITW